MKEIDVIELFAGIGSQTQALKNICVPHKVLGISEIDKYAVKSYEAIHGPVKNFGDITKIKSLPKADMWTYSFPCTDLSVAGQQKGLSRDSGTRSGLLWEVERLLKASELPKYLLLENVKPLVGDKFSEGFSEWRKSLQEMGYRNYYQVLNSKDYGIPQNRERVFMVSILGPGEPFAFPEVEKLEKCLGDLLEDDVDEKYYLSEEQVQNYISNGNGNCHPSGKGMNGNVNSKDIADTLTTNKGEGPKILVRGKLSNVSHEHSSRVYSIEGIAPTIHTMQGGGQEPKVLVKEATKKGYAEAGPGDGISLEYPESNTRRGRVQRGLSATLQCNDNKGVVTSDLRIRKLTQKECFRLMGFSDEAFEKAQSVNSNSQLYKQAGNSIVVGVLERLFRIIFCEDKGNVQPTQMEFF